MTIKCAFPGCGGLSPRVRGNHEAVLAEGMGPRSIPACAGEPFDIDSALIMACCQVYPRVCGGTGVPLLPTSKGSIPACAGEPQAAFWVDSAEGLSPRVRGNLFIDDLVQAHFLRAGLSPRVRGNHIRVWRVLTVLYPGLSPRVRGNP